MSSRPIQSIFQSLSTLCCMMPYYDYANRIHIVCLSLSKSTKEYYEDNRVAIMNSAVKSKLKMELGSYILEEMEDNPTGFPDMIIDTFKFPMKIKLDEHFTGCMELVEKHPRIQFSKLHIFVDNEKSEKTNELLDFLAEKGVLPTEINDSYSRVIIEARNQEYVHGKDAPKLKLISYGSLDDLDQAGSMLPYVANNYELDLTQDIDSYEKLNLYDIPTYKVTVGDQFIYWYGEEEDRVKWNETFVNSVKEIHLASITWESVEKANSDLSTIKTLFPRAEIITHSNMVNLFSGNKSSTLKQIGTLLQTENLRNFMNSENERKYEFCLVCDSCVFSVVEIFSNDSHQNKSNLSEKVCTYSVKNLKIEVDADCVRKIDGPADEISPDGQKSQYIVIEGVHWLQFFELEKNVYKAPPFSKDSFEKYSLVFNEKHLTSIIGLRDMEAVKSIIPEDYLGTCDLGYPEEEGIPFEIENKDNKIKYYKLKTKKN